MRIFLYVDNPFPVGMAPAKRQLCYAKGLAAQGNHVEIYVCNRFFEKGEDDGFSVSGNYEGINFQYVSGKYKHKNKVLRGLDWLYLDHIRTFVFNLRNLRKDDTMFVYIHSVFAQVLLLLAAWIKDVKAVREVCEHPLALGNVNSTWHKLCKWFEFHFVIPHYDGFIVISRELDKFVQKYKGKKAKSIIVPILVDATNSKHNNDDNGSLYEVPYIIHTGTMHEQKDSISKIIKAFARYKMESESDCKLVFTGPQANDKCKYIPLMEQLGVRNSIELLGMVSVERLGRLQSYSVMTIIYKSDNLQTRNCFPTKLGEMLICGVPVITTTIGDANLYLENGKSAYIVEPDDEEALVKFIGIILADKESARRIGEEGKKIAEKYFNPIYQGQRIADFFKMLHR